MKKTILLITAIFAFALFGNAQQKDISVRETPKEVLDVLVQYINILRTSKNLDECADKFLEIAGGGLVNPAGTALRSSVKPYSLKKDFQNRGTIKVPIEIARVAKTKTGQAGYGASAIAGDWYKIYVKKVDGGGRPAPVHIVVPKNHPTVKTPKVTQIGSF
ncbi:MAG: hypothetical protein GXO50_04630 [Chlorobi bacterium]|nr:hypothetical protein [Chlorobiota bacterium]